MATRNSSCCVALNNMRFIATSLQCRASTALHGARKGGAGGQRIAEVSPNKTRKARRGTGERNEGIPRVIMDGRAESADAVGVQLRVLSLVPRARCICRWA